MPNKICVECGKEYHVPKYRELISKYCSQYCLNHGQYKSITKICICCKKEFKVSNSRIKQKYCDILCAKQSKDDLVIRRKKSKRATRISRGVATGKTLRRFVFDNKPKQCELCGYNEYDFCLDIHHIDKNALNNDISNLAILCCMCHKKLHKGVIKYAIN